MDSFLDRPDVDGVEDLVEIGRGGTAIVYGGTQTAFGRRVAVKVLDARLVTDAQKRRFERECRAIGALSGHPNIVTVHGVGLTSGGRPFLIMEFLPHSLADQLVSTGPLHWQDAIDVGRTLGSALSAAHGAGVLHRDVKPENVLLTPSGTPKLTDFGLARLVGETQTETNTIRASLTHASPELIEGKAVTPAIDVYSLASTLHELISGKAPFVRDSDESMLTVLNRILREQPPSLAPYGVSPGLEDVLLKAMSKDPGDRQPSIDTFVSELDRASGAAADKTRVVTRPLPPPFLVSETKTSGNSRRKGLLVPIAFAAILLASGTAWAAADPGEALTFDAASIATTTTVPGPTTTTPTSASEPDPETTTSTTTTTTTTTTTEPTTTTSAPPAVALPADVLTAIDGNPELTNFRYLVGTGGMEDYLRSTPGVTLLVPTNTALTAALFTRSFTFEQVAADGEASRALVAQHIFVDQGIGAGSTGTFQPDAGDPVSVTGGVVTDLGFDLSTPALPANNGSAVIINGAVIPFGFTVTLQTGPTTPLPPVTPTVTTTNTTSGGGSTGPVTSPPIVTASPTTTATTQPPPTLAPTTQPPPTEPTIPPTTAASTVAIPNVNGNDAATAESKLTTRGFNVSRTFIDCDPSLSSIVQSHSPSGSAPAGSTINLVICS